MVTEPHRLRPSTPASDPAEPRRPDAAGFTLVEVIVAVVILTFGLLGLAGTTAWVIRMNTMSEAQTDRTMALQTVIERIRAQPFADVGSGTADLGAFTASWNVTSSGPQYKTVEIVTSGPGMYSGGSGIPSMSNNVADTFVYQVLNP